MIQRIQSVYLLLTTLLSLLFLNGSFLNFIDKSGSVINITFRGITRDMGVQGFELIEKFLPLSVVIILIPAISLITILFFRNRKIQLCLALSGIIFAAGLIIILFYCSFVVITKYDTAIIPGFKMVVPVLILLLTF